MAPTEDKDKETHVEELAFKKKLTEMGLKAQYRERSKYVDHYNITQYRLEITICDQNNKEVEFTTGGFWGKGAYKESAFLQGNRRLQKLQAERR